MTSLRLFIAINLPLEVRKLLEQVQQSLPLNESLVKWVEKENFHLTLEFLGETRKERLSQIEEGLKKATLNSDSLLLDLQEIGAFPNWRNPRVIWVGLGGDIVRLRDLHNRIHQELLDRGFSLGPKRFQPHLTLGRIKQGTPISAGVTNYLKLIPKDVTFAVKQIDLMQSILTREGPIYKKLTSIPLAKAVNQRE